jgi:Tetratricopeptide repeat
MRIEHTGPLIVAAALVILPGVALSDEVFLKSGGRLSGRVVSRTATTVEVDVGEGLIAVPASSVVRIEEGRSPLHEYEERAGRIPAADANAWIALGEWASAQGLSSQARQAYNRALAVSPNDPRANSALGNAQVNGHWVSGDESYRAKGYVKFEGEWMTPTEHEAILRERAAEAEQEHRRAEGEQRAREAEARAQEAEARARQAEAEAKEAQEASEGLPLWYGWGAGPLSWPSGPIVTPYRRVP